MDDLLAWLEKTDEHPLVASCAFHYEFEFIHPFQDGNGRMGRLWQTLILSHWKPVLPCFLFNRSSATANRNTMPPSAKPTTPPMPLHSSSSCSTPFCGPLKKQPS